MRCAAGELASEDVGLDVSGYTVSHDTMANDSNGYLNCSDGYKGIIPARCDDTVVSLTGSNVYTDNCFPADCDAGTYTASGLTITLSGEVLHGASDSQACDADEYQGGTVSFTCSYGQLSVDSDTCLSHDPFNCTGGHYCDPETCTMVWMITQAAMYGGTCEEASAEPDPCTHCDQYEDMKPGVCIGGLYGNPPSNYSKDSVNKSDCAKKCMELSFVDTYENEMCVGYSYYSATQRCALWIDSNLLGNSALTDANWEAHAQPVGRWDSGEGAYPLISGSGHGSWECYIRNLNYVYAADQDCMGEFTCNQMTCIATFSVLAEQRGTGFDCEGLVHGDTFFVHLKNLVRVVEFIKIVEIARQTIVTGMHL
eukprot:UN31290